MRAAARARWPASRRHAAEELRQRRALVEEALPIPRHLRARLQGRDEAGFRGPHLTPDEQPERLQHPDLDQAAAAVGSLRGVVEPVQQAERVVLGAGGEQQPDERQVLVLAAVPGLVRGGEPSFPRPIGCRVQLAAGDPDPRADRADGPHIGEEARVVEGLRGIEERDRLREGAFRAGERCPRHEPPVPALRHAEGPMGIGGRLQMVSRRVAITRLDVELAHPHVQIRGRARDSASVLLGDLECLVVEPASVTGPPGGDPEVREHDRSTERVHDVPVGAEACDRHGERLDGGGDVALRPGCQPEEAGAPASCLMVLRPGEGQGRSRVPHRALDVPLRLSDRGAVHGDGGGQRSHLVTLMPPRARVLRHRFEDGFRLSEAGFGAVEVAGEHPAVPGEHRQHRAALDRAVRQSRQPGEQDGVLPVAADGRSRGLHERAARSKCFPASACSIASGSDPCCSCQRLARSWRVGSSCGCSSSRRARSTSPKRWW